MISFAPFASFSSSTLSTSLDLDEMSLISGKKIPKKPLYVITTHFVVNSNIEKTVRLINDRLGLGYIKEVSFEFNNAIFIWEGVFVHITAYVKFEIRLYSGDEKDEIIVECNRLTGDAIPFFNIYNDIQAAFTEEKCITCKDINAISVYPVIQGMCNPPSEDEALKALEPVLRMAIEDSIDSQQASAHIFCDLAHQDDMKHVLYIANVIETMSKLLKICDHSEKNFSRECICVTTKRLVILAISELSNKSTFHAQIVKDPHLLQNLFKFATHGPYYNVHMRRAAALIIANCSTKGWANLIVNKIGKENLKIWFRKTACVKDKILKNEIERSKKALKKVMIF